MPKVSGEHRSQERRKLVEAAERVFRNVGYGATTEAILEEAGVSAETFGRYFSSKHEILNAVLELRVGETLALVAAEGAPGEADRSLLVRFVVEVLRRPGKSPELVAYRGRVLDDEEVRDSVRELNRWMVEHFSPLVRAAQEAGEVDPGWDPEAVTELVDIIVDGINRRYYSDTFVTGFQRVGDSAMALLLGGFLVPEQHERRGS